MKQRPATSQIVIDEFAAIVDAQDTKGIVKYNETIDDAADEEYNWELMALEETADLQKYLVKQIKMLKKQIRDLRFSQRKALLDKVLHENLQLAEDNKRLKDLLIQASINH